MKSKILLRDTSFSIKFKLWKMLRNVLVLGLIAIYGCSDGSSSGDVGTQGFGVSGLLFENNLVMWFRETDNPNSAKLYPQMYFTRSDVSDFPVWGSFPEEFLFSGGVPRDGIPALTTPKFVGATSGEVTSYLREDDLVLGAVINGDVKAYPENILWWHEIANDEIGGEQVIMTLCPLTGTGIFFRKPLDGNSARELELLPVIETTWRKWKELYPNTRVISENTGISRNYTRYPYNSYRNENSPPFAPLGSGRQVDNRFSPKHTILGLMVGDKQKAYPFSRLQPAPVVNDTFNGLDVLVVSEIGERLAIPYERLLEGQLLTFTLESENPFRMRDNETGSTWNIKGEALDGQLAGKNLTQVPAYNAFWFAWAAFWPDTEVFGSSN